MIINTITLTGAFFYAVDHFYTHTFIHFHLNKMFNAGTLFVKDLNYIPPLFEYIIYVNFHVSNSV